MSSTDELDVDPAVIRLMPGEMCVKHRVMPLRKDGAKLFLAMVDPSNLAVIDELRFLTQYDIVPVQTSDELVEAALALHYRPRLQHYADANDVEPFTNAVLLSMVRDKIRFIAIEPAAVWEWRDGWKTACSLTPKMFDGLIRRICVMSGRFLPTMDQPVHGAIYLKIGDGVPIGFGVLVTIDPHLRAYLRQELAGPLSYDELTVPAPPGAPIPDWHVYAGNPYRQ